MVLTKIFLAEIVFIQYTFYNAYNCEILVRKQDFDLEETVGEACPSQIGMFVCSSRYLHEIIVKNLEQF